MDERNGHSAAFDKSGKVAESDGSALLRLKEGGAFFAPIELSTVAMHWPQVVAGSLSGELYFLEACQD